jgi:hypothetical protein
MRSGAITQTVPRPGNPHKYDIPRAMSQENCPYGNGSAATISTIGTIVMIVMFVTIVG